MPFGLQPLHLVLIVIVALVIFGPSRLPEIGRGVGKAINEFRQGAREMTEGFGEEVRQGPAPAAAVPVPQPDGPTCTSCGTVNPASARFCNKCGTALPAPNACPQCQTVNAPDARFCSNCGGPLNPQSAQAQAPQEPPAQAPAQAEQSQPWSPNA